MSILVQYDENNFEQVERYNGLTIVQFSASWCPACVTCQPVWLTFVRSLPETIHVGRVNMLQAPVLAGKFSIWGLPATLFFCAGHVVGHLSGPQELAEYQAMLHEVQKKTEC